MFNRLKIMYAPDDGAFNQWGFEKGSNSLGNYPNAEVSDDNEPELMILRPGDEGYSDEEEAEKEGEAERQKEKERLEALERERDTYRNQANSTERLNEGFQTLAETLKKQGQAPQYQQPANDPNAMNPAKMAEEFENKLFTNGKTYETFKQGVEQTVMPYLTQLQGTIVEQEKELLKLDGSTKDKFTKYADEIDEQVKSLPPQQRSSPGVYRWAYNQVLARHAGEVEEETVQQKFMEKLEAAGMTLDDEGNVVKKEKVAAGTGETSGSAGNSASSSSSKKKTKKVRITEDDEQAALALGLSVEDYVQFYKKEA